MLRSLLPLSCALLMAGCFNASSDSDQVLPSQMLDSTRALAIAATSPDYSTSDVLLLSATSDGQLRLEEGQRSTTNPTDIALSSHQSQLFRVNRFRSDSITGYQLGADGQLSYAWEYSVLGEDNSANPYAMVVDAEGRGFVTRYDSNDLWVVDPKADSQLDFKTASIDLSAYAIDDDNVPRMTDAAIVGNQLMVLIERLHVSGWTYEARENSQLLVIDLETLAVEHALDLQVRNAKGLSIVGQSIYVAGRGNTFVGQEMGKCQGGIARVDLNAQPTAALLMSECDTGGNSRFGQIGSVVVVNDNHGYFIASEGWQDDKLYHFNPSANDLAASAILVPGTADTGLGGLRHVRNSQEQVIADLVLVSRAASKKASAEIMVIDVSHQPTQVKARIKTAFNPGGMVEVQIP